MPQLLDYLSTDDEAKQKAAVVILRWLEGAKFAAAMASIFHNPGSIKALQSLLNCCEVSPEEKVPCAYHLNVIASLWIEELKYLQVEELTNKSLPLVESCLGSEHRETLRMRELAAIAQRNLRPADADMLLQEVQA
jgi:hypothetical protein